MRSSTKKTWDNDSEIYEKHLAQWSTKKISEIRKSMVQDLHNNIGRRQNHPYQANKVRALLHTMYEFAIERGYQGINPCRGIKRFKELKRDRFLQREELPQFFNAVLNDLHPIIKDFILVALFTGARSGNIQAMRWDEIDFEHSTWTIPETKSGNSHTVPLVPHVTEILEARRNTVTSAWVFPSLKNYEHIVDPKRQWRNICKKAKIDDLRIHDLRRTLGSWMAITGASMLIIAGALGHKIDTSSVTGVYARLDLAPIRNAMETAVHAMLVHGKVIEVDVVPFEKVAK